MKIYRKVENNWLWKNPRYFRAFVWLLFRANWEEKTILFNGTPVRLDRGSFLTSRYHISAATGLSEQEVKTFFQLLQKKDIIRTASSKRATKVTICNYDSYQGEQPTEQVKEQPTEQPTEQPSQPRYNSGSYSGEQPTEQPTEQPQSKKKDERNIVKRHKIIFPFDSDDFFEAWRLWKQYKKDEHRFSYKSPISEQSSLKELAELAAGDEETAIKIIMQSISNGYKGLFKLKSNGRKQRGTDAAELAQLFAEKYAK